MKKWMALLLALSLLVSLAACSDEEQQTKSWDAYYREGKEHLYQNQPEQALEDLQKALNAAPEQEHGQIYLLMIDACVDGDKAQLARGYYEEARSKGLVDGEIEARWQDIQELLLEDSAQQEKNLIEEGGIYTIERVDYSVYANADQTVGARMYYDLLQFDSALYKYEAANEILYACSQTFTQDAKALVQDGLKEKAENAGGLLLNTVDSDISYMEGDYICILHTQTWWMGGVYNVDYDAHVFSQETGDLLTLVDLLGSDKDAATAVRQAVIDYMDTQGDMWQPDAYKKVRTMALEDFEFYLDDGQIILLFDTYVLAPGAAGAIRIPYLALDALGTQDSNPDSL